MRILVDKMPEKPDDCIFARQNVWGYVCFAVGSGDWIQPSCMIYLGGKCPRLKELAEEKEEKAERVPLERAAAEFGRSASETWENANRAIKTIADTLDKPEEEGKNEKSYAVSANGRKDRTGNP